MLGPVQCWQNGSVKAAFRWQASTEICHTCSPGAAYNPKKTSGIASGVKERAMMVTRRILLLFALAWSLPARASLLEGEALDALANGIAWAALVIVPLVLIGVFWWVHIMPEKIAEKRQHPQLAAIKIICLLSLVFGGLLWPIAWVWAYTRPVLHKLAYGTDTLDEHGHGGDAVGLEPMPAQAPQGAAEPTPVVEDTAELHRRIQSLEMQLAAASAPAPGHSGVQEGGV
jgi:hypothetical protein